MAAKRKASNQVGTLTKAELSRQLGVTPKTVYRWIADGMPGGNTGPWDIAAIKAWARARRSESARRTEHVGPHAGEWPKEVPRGTSAAGVREKMEAATLKWREARAGKETVALRKLQGELIEKAEVERLLVERALAFKKSLTSLGRRLAPLVAGMDVREAAARIDDEARAILVAYSRPAQVGDDDG